MYGEKRLTVHRRGRDNSAMCIRQPIKLPLALN